MNKSPTKKKNLISKFRNAFNGLLSGLNDKSILCQYLLMLLAIVVFIYFKISMIEWCLVIMCFALVIGFEYINTCIERTLDLITLEYSNKIKYIKDMSAGFVLLAAIAALVIGIMIIVNHL